MPKSNFAPRLDAAYQLGEKYVLRSGYGLFYGAFENRGGNPSLGYNYPFQFTLIYQSPNAVEPNRLGDGSLATLDARDAHPARPAQRKRQRAECCAASSSTTRRRVPQLQRDAADRAGGQHSLEVGYVGTRGRNLETFTGMNNVRRLLPPGTNPQLHVDWPDFARGMILVRTVGVSSYDSLQIKFQRRFHKGLQFLLAYTLSDATTNAGDSLSGGGVGGLRAPDVIGWDLENDVGLSGFHTRHALVFSGNYDLPGSGPILGGWRANWVMSIYSGQAQTINCTPATGSGTGCYALVVGDPYADAGTVEQFYNPAAFANPAPVATIGQTDFSPLGSEAQPGHRTATASTRPGVRQAVQRLWRSAVRVPCRSLQRDEYALVQPARVAELPRRAELLEHQPACATRRGSSSSA